MKNLPLMLLQLVIVGCGSHGKINVASLNAPRYKYIYDFDSRVSQHRIVGYRAAVSGINAGLLLVQAISSAAIAPGKTNRRVSYNDCSSPAFITLDKPFKNIRLKNDGKSMLYADVVTALPFDENTTANIMNIKLPPGQIVYMRMATDEEYELRYGWSEDSKCNSHLFVPASSKRKLKVSEKGVNRRRPSDQVAATSSVQP